MKTLPEGLQDHLDGGVTTLAWCWRLVRSDGTVMGFTDHDRPIAFDGTIFEAASGFTGSEIESSLGLSVDNLDVSGALSSDRLEEDDLRAGLYDDAKVEIWRVNWQDPEQRVLMRRGNIGEVQRGELSFVAEIRGLAHRLNQEVGRVFSRPCDAVLGDERCKVDLNHPDFSTSGVVLNVTDNRIIEVSGLAEYQAEWFSGGRLTWTDGSIEGGTIELKAHRVMAGFVTLELWERAPRDITPGDTFDVVAGCDKRFATCRDKFDNVANHRGFPHMPGNDVVFSYARQDEGGHDGGSFFN